MARVSRSGRQQKLVADRNARSTRRNVRQPILQLFGRLDVDGTWGIRSYEYGHDVERLQLHRTQPKRAVRDEEDGSEHQSVPETNPEYPPYAKETPYGPDAQGPFHKSPVNHEEGPLRSTKRRPLTAFKSCEDNDNDKDNDNENTDEEAEEGDDDNLEFQGIMLESTSKTPFRSMSKDPGDQGVAKQSGEGEGGSSDEYQDALEHREENEEDEQQDGVGGESSQDDDSDGSSFHGSVLQCRASPRKPFTKDEVRDIESYAATFSGGEQGDVMDAEDFDEDAENFDEADEDEMDEDEMDEDEAYEDDADEDESEEE